MRRSARLAEQAAASAASAVKKARKQVKKRRRRKKKKNDRVEGSTKKARTVMSALVVGSDGRKRCGWRCFQDDSGMDEETRRLYQQYHDEEWGHLRPGPDDDVKLFELLSLSGQQAGVSWNVVFKKRPAYRRVFADFDVERVAQFGDEDLERISQDASIIRNRRKLKSVVTNAKVTLKVREEYGSLYAYLASFFPDGPLVNRRKPGEPAPTQSQLTVDMAKAMKARGFSFVGPTVLYAYLQSVGFINDHRPGCFAHPDSS